MSSHHLHSAEIKTPIGLMLAIANETALAYLDFTDRRDLAQKVSRLGGSITRGKSAPLNTIAQELEAYFEGTLRLFKTPLSLVGTPFQLRVWEALRAVPYGETNSYKDQAVRIGQPTAYRAVANANGANPLAIIIPCHRIIRGGGALGGYGGGIERKSYLLSHEQCQPAGHLS